MSRWPLGVFSAAFVLLMLLSYVGPQAFAPLAAVCAVLVLPWARLPRRGWPWAALGGALLAWGTASLLWTQWPVQVYGGYRSLERLTVLKLALQAVLLPALVLAAARLPQAQARRSLMICAWGLVALSALIALDSLDGGRAYQLMVRLVRLDAPPDIAAIKVSQGSATVALLMWPAGVALKRSGFGWAALAFLPCLAGAAFLLGYDVVVLAAITGGLAFLLVKTLGRPAIRGVAAAVAVYWLAAPLVILGAIHSGLIAGVKFHLPASWAARLYIWTNATGHIAENPLWGWGLDSSRAFAGIPLHTHDGALQVWLELGLPGAVMMAALWVGLFLALDRRLDDRDNAAAGAASAVAFLTIGALSYGVWQDWWLALGALTAAACVLLFTSSSKVVD
jgi:O-antigen ligase